MADTLTLGRRRTVRFSREDDARLEAHAQAEQRPVSEVIREAVRQLPQAAQTSAGEWILSVAQSPAPKLRDDPASAAFRAAYTRRHKQ